MSAKEAAAFVGVTQKTIYRWVREKKVTPAKLPSGLYRFRKEDLISLGER